MISGSMDRYATTLPSFALVAQLDEQRFSKSQDIGSNPVKGANRHFLKYYDEIREIFT